MLLNEKESSMKIEEIPFKNTAIIILLIFSCLVIFNVIKVNSLKFPDISYAKNYVVLESTSNIGGSNPRLDALVAINYDDKMGYKDIAQTAIKAAIELSKKEPRARRIMLKMVDTVDSSPYEGMLAYAVYTPDGKGVSGSGNLTWDVGATNRRYTTLEKNIALMWNVWRNEYANENDVISLEDESLLKKRIAKKLNIKDSDVILPYLSLNVYLKK